MLFVAMLALFLLDVFVEGRSATDILIRLLIHNAPVAIFSTVGFPRCVYLLLAGLPLMVAALFLLADAGPASRRQRDECP